MTDRSKQPTVYGLYQWNQSPNAIEMIAPSQAAARTMATMFGRGRWKTRKLTAAEVADPSVRAAISAWGVAGMRTWEHAQNNIDTHRVIVALGERGNAASYEYVLVDDGLDWHDAQARWQVLDDLRIAGDLPGVAFVAVRSDTDEVDVRMMRPTFLPRYTDAPDWPRGVGRELDDAERIMAYQAEQERARDEAARERARLQPAIDAANAKYERRLARKQAAARRKANPPPPRKLTLAGVEFVGNAGSWTTLDGRYVIETSEFLTGCECLTYPCQHGEDRIRYYDQWIAWDNEKDDYVGGYGPNPVDTRVEAAEMVANAYRQTT